MLVEFYYYFSTFLKCCQSNDRKKAFFTINQLYFCIDSVIFTKFSRRTCFSANGMVYYKSSMRSFLDAIPIIWRRIEVVVTSLTRNQVVRKGTWVRIPPLPPEKPQKRLFLGLFSILLHGALTVCCPAALLPGAGIYTPDRSWFLLLKTSFVA